MKKFMRHSMTAVMLACACGAGAVTYNLVTSEPTIHEHYLDPSDRAPIPPVKIDPPSVSSTTPVWKA